MLEHAQVLTGRYVLHADSSAPQSRFAVTCMGESVLLVSPLASIIGPYTSSQNPIAGKLELCRQGSTSLFPLHHMHSPCSSHQAAINETGMCPRCTRRKKECRDVRRPHLALQRGAWNVGHKVLCALIYIRHMRYCAMLQHTFGRRRRLDEPHARDPR